MIARFTFNPMVRTRPRRRPRRGAALIEAIVGGMMLAAGLAVLVSLASRSITSQQLGEQRVIAAALLDEILNEVLMAGPMDYQNVAPMSGRFDPPFGDYSFALDIVFQGEMEPYFVSATVFWIANGRERSETVQTYMSQPVDSKLLDLRQPGQPIAR